MPTVDKLVQGAKQLKVKEVPGYVSKFAGEHWTPDKTRSRLANWMDRYKVQHIDTGSAKPLFDLITYGFVGAYALAWPTEYAHHKAEQEAKLKGGAAAGAH